MKGSVRPDPAAQPQPQPQPQVHVLVLDDGRRLPLSELMLIGRDPVAEVDESHAVLITVEDPHRSVSKTHLAVGLDAAGPWVRDRFSVNGTTVTTTTTGAGTAGRAADARVTDALDGGADQAIDCPPGVRQPVVPGGTVFFGDRSLTVLTTDRHVVANETTLRPPGGP
jgi:hypothetical protein